MKEITKVLNSLTDDIRSLENSLISEISNSRVETELVLKNLAGYLNIAAQSLTNVDNVIKKFDTTINYLKTEIEKINDIENRVIQLPHETYKIKEEMTKQFTDQSQHLNKILSNVTGYIKKIYSNYNIQNKEILNLNHKIDDLINSVKDNEEEIRNNQTNLTEIITSLITKNQNINQGTIDLQKTKIVQNTKKYQTRLNFWLKIILAILGSGGAIYFILDAILGLI